MAILFTEKYVELIQHARELNRDNKISGNIYFHPQESSKKIIVKTIDLAKSNPLCEVNSNPGKKNKQNWEERWIEAYLIDQAKKNDWEICLDVHQYKFLASQLTFRKHDEWKGTKHIDLLLYDENIKNLVVFELKANSQSFNTAIKELNIYTQELKRLFIENEHEKDGGLRAFFSNSELIKGVVGYVICPKNESNTNEPVDKNFGLYEFSCQHPIIKNGVLTKPWGKYEELKKEKKELVIDFELKKEPE
jgi:hypothetical protein